MCFVGENAYHGVDGGRILMVVLFYKEKAARSKEVSDTMIVRGAGGTANKDR